MVLAGFWEETCSSRQVTAFFLTYARKGEEVRLAVK